MKMPNLRKNQNKDQNLKTKKVPKSGTKYEFENCDVQEQNLLKNHSGGLLSVLPRPLILQQAQEQWAMKVNNLGSVAAQVAWRVICLQS